MIRNRLFRLLFLSKFNMRQYWFIIILLMFAAALDVSFIYPITYLAFTFGFVWTSIIILSIALPFRTALWLALLQGFFIDMISSALFGSYLISALLLVLIISLLRNSLFKQASALTLSIITACSLGVVYIVFFGLHYFATVLGILVVNPIDVVSVWSVLLGIALQCIVVNSIVKTLSLMHRFVWI